MLLEMEGLLAQCSVKAEPGAQLAGHSVKAALVRLLSGQCLQPEAELALAGRSMQADVAQPLAKQCLQPEAE
jgi:hypothetical protein